MLDQFVQLDEAGRLGLQNWCCVTQPRGESGSSAVNPIVSLSNVLGMWAENQGSSTGFGNDWSVTLKKQISISPPVGVNSVIGLKEVNLSNIDEEQLHRVD